jgi:hypothetical protein
MVFKSCEEMKLRIKHQLAAHKKSRGPKTAAYALCGWGQAPAALGD